MAATASTRANSSRPRARYEGIVSRHIVPVWGTVRLGDVSHTDVAARVAALSADGLVGSTVRYIHRVLSLVLDLAVKDGRLARNPADGVRLPRAPSQTKHFPSHRQVDDLAHAAGDYRLAVLVLAYCGPRWGELAPLRVRREDLMRRRLDIAEAVTEVRGHLAWGTPNGRCRSLGYSWMNSLRIWRASTARTWWSRAAGGRC